MPDPDDLRAWRPLWQDRGARLEGEINVTLPAALVGNLLDVAACFYGLDVIEGRKSEAGWLAYQISEACSVLGRQAEETGELAFEEIGRGLTAAAGAWREMQGKLVAESGGQVFHPHDRKFRPDGP